LRESSLHPKFYSPIFFWDVESSSNYAKKLKLTEIAATTLFPLQPFCPACSILNTIIQLHKSSITLRDPKWCPWLTELE
jgi:hypothetical protein